jgi:hypothetical protein
MSSTPPSLQNSGEQAPGGRAGLLKRAEEKPTAQNIQVLEGEMVARWRAIKRLRSNCKR